MAPETEKPTPPADGAARTPWDSFVSPELFECILDHAEDFGIWDERDAYGEYISETLQVFALVHRSWTPSAQKRLFRRVWIREDQWPYPRESQWERLLNILGQAPHLRSLVKELFVQVPCTWTAPLLRNLLPNVVALELHSRLSLQSQRRLVCDLPTLRTLTLGLLAGESEPSFQEAWDGEKLCIENIRSFQGPLPWNNPDVLLRWLTNTGAKTRLRKLRLDIDRRDEQSCLVNFLQSMERLEELELDMAWSWIGDTFENLSFGILHISSLVLHVVPDRNLIPNSLGLLRETQFTALEHLELRMAGEETTLQIGQDGSASKGIFWPFDGVDVFVTSWSLDPSLAARLKRLTLKLSLVSEAHHFGQFLGLFGVAARPGVLRVELDSDSKLLDWHSPHGVTRDAPYDDEIDS